MPEKAVWLVSCLGVYSAFCLYWGLASARAARDTKSFFLADRNLPGWIVVVAATAFAFNGWSFLGHPDLIFRDGFPFAQAALGAVTIALGSAFFLKRQWMLGKRYGYVTPGEMAGHYFGGEVIRLVMVLIALALAVPFAAMQLGALGALLFALTDGWAGRQAAMWITTLVVFAYVCFGGMRAAAHVATLQGVLILAGIVGLGLYAYWLTGGFGDFTRDLASLAPAAAAGPDAVAAAMPASRLFRIPGVIQFTAGLGVEAPVGGLWTALMIFSYCLALMGLSLSPAFSMLGFSSRSPKGFAAQATWASAALLGGVLLIFQVAQAFAVLLLGGSADVAAVGHIFTGGAVEESGVVGAIIGSLEGDAPWFAAIFAVCAVAAVQSLVAISASATSTLIVRDVFKRYIDPALDIDRQRLYARVGVGLIVLAALVLAGFAPAAAVALGSLALGFAAQLLPVLAGICWIPWITRPAATVGLVAGMAFVLFTENFGISLAAFFGLDLPWGRWPWTIHSAGWGLFANILVVFLISLISQRGEERAHRQSFHDFLNGHAVLPLSRRDLRLVAWAVALAWLFFAIGPGAVIGNAFFGDAGGGAGAWLAGVPPLWAWQFVWWALGVLLVWFLASRMGMATMPSKFIEPATKAERSPRPPSMSGLTAVQVWFWVAVLVAASATLLHWMFAA